MTRRVTVRQRPPDLVTIPSGGSTVTCIPIRTWTLAALLLTAVVAGAGGTRLANVDVADGLWDVADGLRDGAGILTEGAARINWVLVPLIVGLTALHYLTSALGVRATAYGASSAVSGGRLRIWETMTSQFAGAAANRLAPAGLGSATLTCRYLTRRGLSAGAAATTVAMVSLVRGLTKLALVTLVIALWSDLGDAAMPTTELGRLVSRHSGTLLPAAVTVTCAVTLLAVTTLYRRRRRTHVRIRTGIAGAARSLRSLLRRPRCLVASFAAATAADLVLALAFAVSVMAIAGSGRTSVTSLLGVYLLGATAGAAIPMPAGVGSTEAALITALATVHMPTAQAAQGVLLFRVMTFWAPVPAGVLSTRWLRRRGGL